MASKNILALLLICTISFQCQRLAANALLADDAKAAFAAGDYAKAIELLNREIASSPRDAAAQYLLARCYFEDEQFDRAIPPAEAEFQKALALHPKSADLIYDIGDHYMKRSQPDRLQVVVAEGERAAPGDPRANFFRGVILALEKKNETGATKLFREYIANTPKRNNYPSKAMAHYWLGRIQENQNNAAAAKTEYREALSLEPKNRLAKEALNRLQHD